MDKELAKTSDEDVEVLERLVRYFETAEQASADSRQEAERDRDYVNGSQWTDQEIAALKKRKQPIVTINRIGPKVRFLQGMEQQHRASPKAYPRTPDDEEGANAASDSLRFVCDQNRWDDIRSECFSNHAVEGDCGVDVKIVERYGEPCIELNHIPWDRRFADPHSRKRDYSDAKYKGHYLWMDLDEASDRWPEGVEFLDSTISSEASADTHSDIPRTRWADPKRKRVRIVEIWTKEKGGKWFYTAYTRAGVLERMGSPYQDENGEPDDGFVFGSCFIDRDGNRFGVVRDWISVQDEINKRRSKAMHLLNVRQVVADKGAVDDVNKARAELARPDGFIEKTPDMQFEVLDNGELAAGQLGLLQEAKQEIDAVGVNAALGGKDGRVQSGRALIQKSEQGMTELGPAFDSFKQFQLDVYRKIWNRVRQFWTAEKWIRVTDDEKNIRFVGLNSPLTLGEQKLEQVKKSGRQVPPEVMQQMEEQAKMDPAMQQVVGVKNNVAQMDVDITIDAAPASASLQGEQFETLAQIAPQAGAMPPPLFEALIEASSLRNKDKILRRLKGEDEGGKSPQIQQMEQQMQEMKQALQDAQQSAESKQGDMQIKQSGLELKSREIAIKERELQMKVDELQMKQSTGMDSVQAGIDAQQVELKLRAMALEYERKLFDAQKQIAILEVRAAETGAAHAIESAEASLSHAAESAIQQADIETIRVSEE